MNTLTLATPKKSKNAITAETHIKQVWNELIDPFKENIESIAIIAYKDGAKMIQALIEKNKSRKHSFFEKCLCIICIESNDIVIPYGGDNDGRNKNRTPTLVIKNWFETVNNIHSTTNNGFPMGAVITITTHHCSSSFTFLLINYSHILNRNRETTLHQHKQPIPE